MLRDPAAGDSTQPCKGGVGRGSPRISGRCWNLSWGFKDNEKHEGRARAGGENVPGKGAAWAWPGGKNAHSRTVEG